MHVTVPPSRYNSPNTGPSNWPDTDVDALFGLLDRLVVDFEHAVRA